MTSPFSIRLRPGSRASARRSAAFLPFALVLSVSACDAPAVEDLGVSWELAQHRAATLSDVEYRFELVVPDDLDVPLSGATEIRFRREDASGAPVTVDFKDPGERVRRVEVDGDSVPWRAENDHIVIADEHFAPSGPASIRIVHDAGDEALNRNPEFLYTLFVPDRAHFSLPVFDQPNLKARVTWDLTVPAGWVAVGNGRTVEAPGIPADLAGLGVAPEDIAPEGDAGVRRYVTAPSDPLPTYLFAFSAGRFQVERGERDGRVFTMFHRETDRATVERNAPEIFDLHARALAWLEDYTAIDYPFQKFDFVLIPPFQYGGMEHPGAVTYRQSSLMLDATATQGSRLGRASLISHETAHMWFGDLVTMNWFDDVWTKEVFANFMAAKIVEPSFPEVDHQLRFLTAHAPAAWGVDRTPGANPIRQPLENLREAGTLYGAIIYQKAPIVMKQLERTVGEEVFRDGMREYLAEHAYGNATWPDLIRVLDARHPSDLAAWSEVWVEEPGRPVIRLRFDATGEGTGRVVLAQEDAWGRGRIWPQQMDLAAFVDGEARTLTVDFTTAELVPEAWSGIPRPDFVLPNASGVEYGLFLPEDAWIDGMMAAMPTLRPDLWRGAAWIDLRELLLEGRVEPTRALDLALDHVLEEENELVLSQMLGTVSSVFWGMMGPDARAEHAVRIEETLWQGVVSAPDVSRRSSFFSAFRGVSTTPAALRRLERIWAGDEEVAGLPLSENDRIALATELALHEVDGAEEILDRMQDEIANPDRKARFEWLRPALSADPASREAFFASLADEDNREREPWVLSGLGYLNHPLRLEHARRFVRPSLELVEEIQATGDIFFPQRWLAAALGSHSDPEVVAEIEAFLRERPDYPPRLRGKILQEYDGVRRAARSVHGAASAPEWTPWQN